MAAGCRRIFITAAAVVNFRSIHRLFVAPCFAFGTGGRVCRFLLRPAVCIGGKDAVMELRVRYDNKIQTLELDEKATKQMFVTLGIEEDENVTKEENEKRIQEAFDEQYNKPEYNNWHQFDRHRGYSTAKPDDGEEDADPNEPRMDEVFDKRIFNKDELEREAKYENDAVCDGIRKSLVKKPEWADAFIAVRINGEPVHDYAKRIGTDENSVSQKLKRAAKKLGKNYKKRQI
jgi:hypothetical protein